MLEALNKEGKFKNRTVNFYLLLFHTLQAFLEIRHVQISCFKQLNLADKS